MCRACANVCVCVCEFEANMMSRRLEKKRTEYAILFRCVCVTCVLVVEANVIHFMIM